MKRRHFMGLGLFGASASVSPMLGGYAGHVIHMKQREMLEGIPFEDVLGYLEEALIEGLADPLKTERLLLKHPRSFRARVREWLYTSVGFRVDCRTAQYTEMIPNDFYASLRYVRQRRTKLLDKAMSRYESDLGGMMDG